MTRTTLKFTVTGNTHEEIISRADRKVVDYIGDSKVTLGEYDISIEDHYRCIDDPENEDKYFGMVYVKVKDV